jgi:hypothetical protein
MEGWALGWPRAEAMGIVHFLPRDARFAAFALPSLARHPLLVAALSTIDPKPQSLTLYGYPPTAEQVTQRYSA